MVRSDGRRPGRWAASLGWVIAFIGCALPRGGLLESTCATDADCPAEADPCLRATCSAEGVCTAVAVAEPAQVVGDCQQLACADGVVSVAAAPDDVPPDEGCTAFSCEGTEVVTTTLVAGEPCTTPEGNSGFCTADGMCDDFCSSDADCSRADLDNPCRQSTCNISVGRCETEALDGVDAPDQAIADCQVVRCVDGEAVSENDDTDIPFDGLDCTDDRCSAGTPSNDNRAEGETCGAEGATTVCDREGNCVGCNGPDDCGVTSFCTTFTCEDNVCGVSFQPEGTALPASDQTTGDCRERQCGMGGMIRTRFDAGDPRDDGNDCTSDTCRQSPIRTDHDALMEGLACAGGVCNGDTTSPACVECTEDGDCGTDETCTAANVCRTDAGASCVNDGECATGVCSNADGVCCNTECTGVCRSCALAGTRGTCTPYGVGTDPENECGGANATQPPQCGGGLACGCGADPVPTGPVGTCPNVCSSCMAVGGRSVCIVNCASGMCRGRTISCPPNFDCEVNCAGNNACRRTGSMPVTPTVVNCPANFRCAVECDGVNACQGLALNCDSNGSCELACNGNDAGRCANVTQACGDDACDATCGAPTALSQPGCGSSCGCTSAGC